MGIWYRSESLQDYSQQGLQLYQASSYEILQPQNGLYLYWCCGPPVHESRSYFRYQLTGRHTEYIAVEVYNASLPTAQRLCGYTSESASTSPKQQSETNRLQPLQASFLQPAKKTLPASFSFFFSFCNTKYLVISIRINTDSYKHCDIAHFSAPTALYNRVFSAEFPIASLLDITTGFIIEFTNCS